MYDMASTAVNQPARTKRRRDHVLRALRYKCSTDPGSGSEASFVIDGSMFCRYSPRPGGCGDLEGGPRVLETIFLDGLRGLSLSPSSLIETWRRKSPVRPDASRSRCRASPGLLIGLRKRTAAVSFVTSCSPGGLERFCTESSVYDLGGWGLCWPTQPYSATGEACDDDADGAGT